MALIMFLFGSILGLIGAVLQLILGFDFGAAFQTYAVISFGFPTVTLLAYSARHHVS